MLTVSGLSFEYRHVLRAPVPVLRDVSFCLEAGRCLVVAGANGSGKSTLLSILSGALTGWKGSIKSDGESIGLVPQGFSAFDDLTVRQNLRFFAGLCGRRVPDPLPYGLEPYADRRAGALSGGLRKRLCIACTAVSEPDIWLFDEPCANLDIVWRDEMIHNILNLKAKGCAVLYVGHDPAEFSPFYDSLMLLQDGTGTPVGREEIPTGAEAQFLRSRLREDSVLTR